MKLALAVCLLAVTAVVVIFAVIVRDNKDHGPDQIRACAEELPLPRIISIDALGPARQDLQNGTLGVERQLTIKGGTQATILVPEDRIYTMVALTDTPQSPRAVLQRIATEPDALAGLFEARSPELGRALRACVAEQAA